MIGGRDAFVGARVASLGKSSARRPKGRPNLSRPVPSVPSVFVVGEPI